MTTFTFDADLLREWIAAAEQWRVSDDYWNWSAARGRDHLIALARAVLAGADEAIALEWAPPHWDARHRLSAILTGARSALPVRRHPGRLA